MSCLYTGTATLHYFRGLPIWNPYGYVRCPMFSIGLVTGACDFGVGWVDARRREFSVTSGY